VCVGNQCIFTVEKHISFRFSKLPSVSTPVSRNSVETDSVSTWCVVCVTHKADVFLKSSREKV
jgi:hypothetical protein